MSDRDRELHEMADEGRALMTDYIKREEAIKASTPAFRNAFSEWEDGWIESKDDTKNMIENLPSADVAQVRHGRWKPFDRTYGRTIFACSECGDCTDVPTEMGEPIFGYCPNCGAKMDKENEQ